MEESYTLCEVLVVRLDGTTPIKYAVRLNSEARLVELKRKLSSLCSVPVHRIRLAEVCDSQIRRILADSARVSTYTSLSPELMAYEVCGSSFDCDPTGTAPERVHSAFNVPFSRCFRLRLRRGRRGLARRPTDARPEPRGKRHLSSVHAQHSVLQGTHERSPRHERGDALVSLVHQSRTRRHERKS